jgi:hypothetical protein
MVFICGRDGNFDQVYDSGNGHEVNVHAAPDSRSVEAHLYPCSGHIQSGHRLRSSHSVKNSEFGGIANYGAGLPEWRQKNEKDSLPIHSREQSFQIILLNVRGLNSAI